MAPRRKKRKPIGERIRAEVAATGPDLAYLRFPDWSEAMLVCVPVEVIAATRRFEAGRTPNPARGMVYTVEALFSGPPPEVVLQAWERSSELECLRPIAPPGNAPDVGEDLPIVDRDALYSVVRSVAREKLSKATIHGICYLIRKAYGRGFVNGRKDNHTP